MIGVLFYFRQSSKKKSYSQGNSPDQSQFTIEVIIAIIKEAINESTRSNLYDQGLSEQAFKRKLSKRSELKKALKSCSYGSTYDKEYVKDYIKDLLRQGYLSQKNIDMVIPFNRVKYMTIEDKFDVLLHHYKKLYQYDALSQMMEDYELHQLKHLIEDGQVPSYIITAEEIDHIYQTTQISLTFEDKLAIVSQRVYQTYKGFGVIDEIRDMNIDGVSGGVSGIVNDGHAFHSIDDNFLSQMKKVPYNYDSIWIFYKGKSIHLSFLSFKTDNELRRVCQNIYRYNKAGQLSENIGYKVNEMQDGSRVVVVRPSFSESWAFFVRKFHIADVTLEELIQDDGCQLPIELLKFLTKGARITSITGSQGSGKTTLLMALVKSIYATLTLRVQEMSFELHLRKVYPMRNILTFKETTNISGQAGLDVQKKTDGAVNILGEVATDEVAVWMLQMAQVASLFTLFTHHAKTVRDLSLSLRNSLLKCDVFRDERIAEEQVVNVLDFDVHLEKDESGKRYISRITEIIGLDQELPYPTSYKYEGSHEDKLNLFMDTITEYFTRQTDRKIYKANNIVEFVEGRYEAKTAISNKTIEAMKRHMTLEDQCEFSTFIQSYWEPAYEQ